MMHEESQRTHLENMSNTLFLICVDGDWQWDDNVNGQGQECVGVILQAVVFKVACRFCNT
jgi:hypothetical protein